MQLRLSLSETVNLPIDIRKKILKRKNNKGTNYI